MGRKGGTNFPLGESTGALIRGEDSRDTEWPSTGEPDLVQKKTNRCRTFRIPQEGGLTRENKRVLQGSGSGKRRKELNVLKSPKKGGEHSYKTRPRENLGKKNPTIVSTGRKNKT